jgi:hypothetical protein
MPNESEFESVRRDQLASQRSAGGAVWIATIDQNCTVVLTEITPTRQTDPPTSGNKRRFPHLQNVVGGRSYSPKQLGLVVDEFVAAQSNGVPHLSTSSRTQAGTPNFSSS